MDLCGDSMTNFLIVGGTVDLLWSEGQREEEYGIGKASLDYKKHSVPGYQATCDLGSVSNDMGAGMQYGSVVRYGA